MEDDIYGTISTSTRGNILNGHIFFNILGEFDPLSLKLGFEVRVILGDPEILSVPLGALPKFFFCQFEINSNLTIMYFVIFCKSATTNQNLKVGDLKVDRA